MEKKDGFSGNDKICRIYPYIIEEDITGIKRDKPEKSFWSKLLCLFWLK